METGIGIRSAHFDDALNTQANIGFFEAHSENYFGDSLSRKKLTSLREKFPVSLHGVGLSLGRADGLDKQHLQELKRLVNDIDPLFVSEHLSWSAYAHTHVPDLLPLPLTAQALQLMCEHIEQMQDTLQRPILLENPSNYLLFDELQIPEPEFLNSLAKKTGCGLLLDVNNVYVSATNLDKNPKEYLQAINPEYVSQYHLAGYSEHKDETEQVLIDTHNQYVHDPVWDLYEFTLKNLGDKPTLVEWDADLPEFDVLIKEAQKAEKLRTANKAAAVKGEEAKGAEGSNKQYKTTEIDGNKTKSDLPQLQEDFIGGLFSNEINHFDFANNEFKHRYWIYQNNVQQGLISYLASVYEACQQLVGERFFRAMAAKYVANQVPNSGDIHQYGADFAEFIEGFEHAKSLPYLPDVARFEWLKHRAYYAKSAKLFSAEDMGSYPQEQQLTLPLSFNDSVGFLRSDFPVAEIVKQSLPETATGEQVSLEQGGVCLMVCKHQNSVEVIEQSAELHTFMQAIQNSQNILSAIQAVAEDVEQEQISQGIAQAFEYDLFVLESNEK